MNKKELDEHWDRAWDEGYEHGCVDTIDEIKQSLLRLFSGQYRTEYYEGIQRAFNEVIRIQNAHQKES